MYWLDIAILALLGFGAALGFWSGLLWQVARLVSLGLSFYATLLLNEPVTQLLSEQVAPEADTGLLRAAAYVVAFLAVYILLFAITRMLHNAIRATKLEWVDRTLGAALGAGKMALLLVPLCAGLAYMSLPITEEWMSRSVLAPEFARGLEKALAVIPQEYRDQANDGADQVRDMVQRGATEKAAELLQGELSPR